MPSDYERMVQKFSAEANRKARVYARVPNISGNQDLGDPYTNLPCGDYSNDVASDWRRGMSNGLRGSESAEGKSNFDSSQARLTSVPRSGRKEYGYQDAAGTPYKVAKGVIRGKIGPDLRSPATTGPGARQASEQYGFRSNPGWAKGRAR
jgi:hypothetical protein